MGMRILCIAKQVKNNWPRRGSATMTPHHWGDPRMPLAPTSLLAAALVGDDERKEPQAPLFSNSDLDRGDSVEVKPRDGSKASVKLLNVKETRDPLRAALRWADVA